MFEFHIVQIVALGTLNKICDIFEGIEIEFHFTLLFQVFVIILSFYLILMKYSSIIILMRRMAKTIEAVMKEFQFKENPARRTRTIAAKEE